MKSRSLFLITTILVSCWLGSGCRKGTFDHGVSGRVVDSRTGEGIVGMEITCMIEERDCDYDCDSCGHCDCDCETEYTEESRTYSARDGYFYAPYNEPCELWFHDVDEGRNGGRFADRSAASCAEDGEVIVELEGDGQERCGLVAGFDCEL